jgi:hypothetical protein
MRLEWLLLPAAALAAGPDLVKLFNLKSPWVVEEGGVLALKDRTDGKMRNANYLWSREQYGDFTIELEYKVPEDRANSGVFIRTADTNDPVQTGIEIQVGNWPADRPAGRGGVGGIYDLVAPARNAHKAGAWNRYAITAKGSRITVVLNGVTTAEADLEKWTEARKNPDGSPNKFRRPLKEFARKGYIGFQDHGSPAWYRNIRIKRLD